MWVQGPAGIWNPTSLPVTLLLLMSKALPQKHDPVKPIFLKRHFCPSFGVSIASFRKASKENWLLSGGHNLHHTQEGQDGLPLQQQRVQVGRRQHWLLSPACRRHTGRWSHRLVQYLELVLESFFSGPYNMLNERILKETGQVGCKLFTWHMYFWNQR